MRKFISIIKIATIVVLSVLGILNIGIFFYNKFAAANEVLHNSQFLIMGLIYLGGAAAISFFRIRKS